MERMMLGKRIYPAPEPDPPEDWDGVETCPSCNGEGCSACRWVGAVEALPPCRHYCDCGAIWWDDEPLHNTRCPTCGELEGI